jgi:dGTPase
LYAGKDTLKRIEGQTSIYPILANTFSSWLKTYSDVAQSKPRSRKLQNEIIYNLDNKVSYIQCICDFISGMTDNFAIRVFNELTSF